MTTKHVLIECQHTETRREQFRRDIKDVCAKIQIDELGLEEMVFWNDNLNVKVREARKFGKWKHLLVDLVIMQTMKYAHYAVQTLKKHPEMIRRTTEWALRR